MFVVQQKCCCCVSRCLTMLFWWPFGGGQGAHPSAIGGVLKESALMWAARQGFMAVVSDLLDVSDIRACTFAI